VQSLIVDTSVWSLLLRRRKTENDDARVQRLRSHIEHNDNVYLLGIVLQELLDGLKGTGQFDLLAEYLRPFPLIEPVIGDYIDSARFKTHCRNNGVQAGTVDFLIAAVCINRGLPLLTADNDFEHIARWCNLRLVIRAADCV
jgi:hypothetical protein